MEDMKNEINPNEVRIVVTPTIDRALRFALLTKQSPPTKKERELFSNSCHKKEIPVSTVFSLSSFLRRHHHRSPEEYSKAKNPPPIFLNQLLEGTKISFEKLKPKPPPVDPEAQAKLAELRALHANREYEKMVRNVTETRKDRWAKDTRELSGSFSQASVGINILVSMATCLATGYWFGISYFGKPAIAIACAVVLMTVVLMAEMWLFIIRAERLDSQLKTEKKQKMVIGAPKVSGLPGSYSLSPYEKKSQ